MRLWLLLNKGGGGITSDDRIPQITMNLLPKDGQLV